MRSVCQSFCLSVRGRSRQPGLCAFGGPREGSLLTGASVAAEVPEPLTSITSEWLNSAFDNRPP